ncbi:MAG: ABC transporter permease, partial [Candidatus Hodarchaeota archaeon]
LTNVANAVIRVTSRDLITGIRGMYSYYSKTDENGYYQVRGVSSSRPDNPLEFSVEAYTFNSEGKLIKANNLGSYGQSFKKTKQLINKEIVINPMVFNCGTIGVFGVSHPYYLFPSAEFLNYEVLDPETQIQHFSHGYLGIKSVSLVFVSPDTPSILIGEFPDGILVVYATNSSTKALQGYGFLVQKGEFKNLGLSAFITSKDILSLTQAYIDLYISYSIYDDQVNKTVQKLITLIESAIQLKKNYDYSIAIETITEAQIWSYNALNQARNVIMGGMSAALLFAFLFIPFSFILFHLLFNPNSWVKQVLMTCSIYALTFSLFYLIHPGFQLAPHLIITLIGIINVSAVLIIFYFFSQGSYDFLRSQRTRMLGSHFTDTSITSAILIAFKTGISRMKKHKFRTIITLSNIGLLTFALTLLTSASALVRNNFLELGLLIVIAMLLMINTSITVVYSSKREISIFTSLGVTPTHIISLFLTEFLVSAIVGSVFGYLGGITFIRMVSTVGLIPKTLPINYSSGAVVTALAFSTVGMLLSIIYPLKISGQMSVPSLKRTWVLTTLPEEDGTIWNIQLPVVTATEQEAEGIIEFLREFFVIFESESVGGGFSVSNIDIKNSKGKEKQLTATVTLAPFDMGIKQTMKFITYFDKIQDHWTFEIKLARLEGVLMAWEASVRRFIGDIRKQLLIWKKLSEKDKASKIERFQQEFS